MKQSIGNKQVGTVGDVSADIYNAGVNPAAYSFRSDDTFTAMWQEGGDTSFAVNQDVGGAQLIWHYFSFKIVGLVDDGSPHTYNFADTAKITAYYFTDTWGEIKPYVFESGSMTVSLDKNDQLIATFSGVAAWNSDQVSVTNGEVNLTGFVTSGQVVGKPASTGTGTMVGKILGGPAPNNNFSATVVENIHVPESEFPPIPAYYRVRGIYQDAFPPVQNVLAIVVPESAKGTTFSFPNNDGVSVTYTYLASSHQSTAVSGTLTFTSHPETKRATGHADLIMRGTNYPDYVLECTFDIVSNT